MGSNSIGKEFVVTCFGESHGKCIGVIVDGCPAGLRLSRGDLQRTLDRRTPEATSITSGRKEKDTVKLLSGVFNGFSTGAPICGLIWNKDTISEDYKAIRNTPRPGHADYTAHIKYGGYSDYRGGGRFSGRITVAFLMAGAIARKLLKLFKVEILAYTSSIGEVSLTREPTIRELKQNTYKNDTRCPNPKIDEKMKKTIWKARSEGESLGGIIECIAYNVPRGAGEPIFDSLDSEIAKVLFDIPAIKGVEFGAGFSASKLKGSQNNDAFIIQKGKIRTLTNNAGGVLGGLSTGMPIKIRIAVKPTPSIQKKQKTVDLSKKENTTIQVKGRHNPCIVPKAVPAVESVVSIILVDQMLRGGIIPKVLGRK